MSSSDKIPADQVAWREMEEFFDRCKAAGPPISHEEAARRGAEFVAIQARCRARAAPTSLLHFDFARAGASANFVKQRPR
jgi:hypothetical protein